MEEKQEMLELMKKMEESSRKQLLYTRIMCGAAIVSAVCFVGILVLIWGILPQVQSIMDQIPGLVAQLETVLGNLEVVTTDLASVDFAGMVNGINELVITGQTSLERTLTQLNELDLESLNKAIANLAALVEPMAKFFKVLR